MPTVTVVIPTYERADVLPRAIDSALSQTHGDLEVLVVDDGSGDDTEAVVADYDDDRVRYVAHETNRGANVARNTGIRHADGEYVAFLDSDDAWFAAKLETQLAAIESADAVAAFCRCERSLEGPVGQVQSLGARVLALADDEPTTVAADPADVEGDTLAAEILAGAVHPAAGSTLVVETALAREIGGFDEDLDRFQDPEIVLRIIEEGRVVPVEEALAVRFDTGEPAPEVVHAADRQYLAKHADAVERAEALGYDVRGRHDFLLAKHYLAAGRPRAGLALLRESTVDPRHVPGLLWAVGAGARRRLEHPVAGVAAVGALLVVVGLLVLARRPTSR